jgi:hypothetical protein
MVSSAGVGEKKGLSEHASELARPRGGEKPRFRTFAGLDDGTLGQAGVYKPTEIIATSCDIHLRRPLSQKSGFCVVGMKRNFSFLLFSWGTVAKRATVQGGRGKRTG